MRLSEKVVALRKRQELSQEDLAEKLNVSRQTIISLGEWYGGARCLQCRKAE